MGCSAHFEQQMDVVISQREMRNGDEMFCMGGRRQKQNTGSGAPPVVLSGETRASRFDQLSAALELSVTTSRAVRHRYFS
jgi:hypothetical protein